MGIQQRLDTMQEGSEGQGQDPFGVYGQAPAQPQAPALAQQVADSKKRIATMQAGGVNPHSDALEAEYERLNQAGLQVSLLQG